MIVVASYAFAHTPYFGEDRPRNHALMYGYFAPTAVGKKQVLISDEVERRIQTLSDSRLRKMARTAD